MEESHLCSVSILSPYEVGCEALAYSVPAIPLMVRAEQAANKESSKK